MKISIDIQNKQTNKLRKAENQGQLGQHRADVKFPQALFTPMFLFGSSPMQQIVACNTNQTRVEGNIATLVGINNSQERAFSNLDLLQIFFFKSDRWY